jgi:aminodeoxychorismate synthase component I
VTSWVLHCRELAGVVDAERAFEVLFGSSRWAFWLDSSLVDGPARYSLLGDAGGPHGDILQVRVTDLADVADLTDRGSGTVFDALERRLADRAVRVPDDLPAALACGYVGYFGYELKAYDGLATPHDAPLPDATWLSATRYAVIDHRDGRTWVCELTADTEPPRWIDVAVTRLRGLPDVENPLDMPEAGVDPAPWLARPRDRYLADVETCLDRLRAGESYEICLTNSVELPFDRDPWLLYRRLRRINPAPYAAFLRLGDAHVLSASPERFLTVDAERHVESRPIKGTAARAADPGIDALLGKELASNAKTQAENLMIVDLLRNDLGRVCEPGTIGVPAFLALESYATVHQLVSTVRGRLRPGVSAVQAARACFPPGSMTGAPKLRTMEILDELEGRPRGIYSGAVGHFGLAGTADLSVVIRTAVVHAGLLTVGAGGAIVLDSDPEEEYDEMLLKAAVPLRALSPPVY